MQHINHYMKLYLSISLLATNLLLPSMSQSTTNNESISLKAHTLHASVLNVPTVIEDTVYRQQKFKEQLASLISNWQQTISQDEQFSIIAKAKWGVQPLGPGSQSFLVLFYDSSNQATSSIGYLIVHASPTGELVIGEYGKGLYESLDISFKSPLLIYYIHPFQAGYSNEEQIVVDLFTNESYPIGIDELELFTPSSIDIMNEYNQLNAQAIYSSSSYTDYFSPYDKLPWLTSKSINNQLIEDRAIETDIELGTQLYYRVKSWDSKISTVYAVTSLHKWDEKIQFIGLQLEDEHQIRYIPYDTLLQYGHFYSS